jgi:hypothetical protein
MYQLSSRGDTSLTAGPGWMCTHQVVGVDLEKCFPDISTPAVDLVPGRAPDLELDSRSDISPIARPAETARGPAAVSVHDLEPARPQHRTAVVGSDIEEPLSPSEYRSRWGPSPGE